MVKPEMLGSHIQSSMPFEFVDVHGDSHRFVAAIVSSAFRGKFSVQKHQIAYCMPGEQMREDIHALSMKIYSPEEWTG